MRCFPPLPTHPCLTAPPIPSQLLVEVVQQLQRMFTPDVKVIKRAIDSLIDVSLPSATVPRFCCGCPGGRGSLAAGRPRWWVVGMRPWPLPVSKPWPSLPSAPPPAPAPPQRDYLERDTTDPQLYKYLA